MTSSSSWLCLLAVHLDTGYHQFVWTTSAGQSLHIGILYDQHQACDLKESLGQGRLAKPRARVPLLQSMAVDRRSVCTLTPTNCSSSEAKGGGGHTVRELGCGPPLLYMFEAVSQPQLLGMHQVTHHDSRRPVNGQPHHHNGAA